MTAVCRGEKAEAVRALGADRVVDYTREEIGTGYDFILDVGGNTPLSKLRKAMTAVGTLVFVGGENGGDFTAGFERQLLAAFLGMFVKQKFSMLMAAEHFAPLEELAALVDAGTLRPLIDRAWPLAQVPEAMEAFVDGKVTGKTVIRVA